MEPFALEDRSSWESAERVCWLDVDLDAVAANVRAIKALIGPGREVCAVVKADAYGLGAAEVARAALAAGAGRVAVARVSEGVQLRAVGIHEPILLIAAFAPGEAEQIVRHSLTPTVVQVSDVLAIGRAAGRAGAVVPVHIKVDTGLTRLGASPSEVRNLARLVRSLSSLYLEGVYTHFASADEPDTSFAREQLRCFHALLGSMAGDGTQAALVHAANSAATLTLPVARLDMVRVGLTLSGHSPLVGRPAGVELRPAVALRARLQRVYAVPAGASIGYGRTFTAEREMRVGLVPAGYADGVPRAHSGRSVALVGGHRAPLIGRVSMDQCVVDLTGAPDVRHGDTVTFFGEGGGDRIPLEEFAGWSDTISHEALCRIGARVPRLYRESGRVWWGDGDSSPRRVTAASAVRW